MKDLKNDKNLVIKRLALRRLDQFKKADKIRKDLVKKGYSVHDEREGTRISWWDNKGLQTFFVK